MSGITRMNLNKLEAQTLENIKDKDSSIESVRTSHAPGETPGDVSLSVKSESNPEIQLKSNSKQNKKAANKSQSNVRSRGKTRKRKS